MKELGLFLSLRIAVYRFHRGRCAACQKRRVLFVLAVSGGDVTDGICAVCAGLR